MEKNNGKIIAVVALVVAVVALSVGFAAFADTLTIQGNATVEKAADAFEGSFQYDESVTPTCKAGSTTLTLTSPYSPGTVSGDTWTGISVPLKEGAYTVECTATIKNTSAYDAYLTKLSVNGPITCASTGANAASNTTDVCSRITGTVQVGASGNTLSFNKDSTSSTAVSTGLTASVAKTNGTETVKVTITFDSTTAPAVVPDGDITVTLPTISHDYSTVRPTS